jgi:hypothetical protein
MGFNTQTCAANPTPNQQITLNQLMTNGITPIMNANTLGTLRAGL